MEKRKRKKRREKVKEGKEDTIHSSTHISQRLLVV